MNGGIEGMAKTRNLCKEVKKELKILADDFGLLYMEEVQDIIETCTSYAEGWKGIMKIYEKAYMK